MKTINITCYSEAEKYLEPLEITHMLLVLKRNSNWKLEDPENDTEYLAEVHVFNPSL